MLSVKLTTIRGRESATNGNPVLCADCSRGGGALRGKQCAALTSFRVGKMSFLWKKGIFFTILLKRCEKGWTEASLADMFWAEMTKMSKT